MMPPPPDEEPTNRGTSLAERAAATEEFADMAARLMGVGDLRWSDVDADYRLLAINSALCRQLESIRAAILLSRQGLGHLAVAFVRASIEDVMYLEFFARLDLRDSQELFKLMGSWDNLRSLLAQRDYLGDEAMSQLWYPVAFLRAAANERDVVKTKLRAQQQEHRWSGGLLPSGDWIADISDQRPLYDYLHAATSRALHFSAGEIMRRGWGHPHGKLVTDKLEFREHLASFALDQLWRLYLDTWRVALPVQEVAGVSSDESLRWEHIEPVLNRLLKLGKVPLVHAHEWNLTPDGPLDLGMVNPSEHN